METSDDPSIFPRLRAHLSARPFDPAHRRGAGFGGSGGCRRRAGSDFPALDRVQMAQPERQAGDLRHRRSRSAGGYKGWLGLAEQVSDISLACSQTGPIRFKTKLTQGDDIYQQRRSFLFKKMQIVRGCDTKRNVLVYMVYSDRIIEGSPKNSTSNVSIMPWGADDANVQKCSEFFK
jgi:hypothetical protein